MTAEESTEERPYFIDSDDHELFEDVPQDQLAALLKVARDLACSFEWQCEDAESKLWTGSSGRFAVSFYQNDDDDKPIDGRTFIATVEADADDASMALIAAELFPFDGIADAKARAVRLLLLALGPVGSALLNNNPSAGKRR